MSNDKIEDLLSDLGNDDTNKAGETTDLLNEIDDSGAPAFVAENKGDGIQGTVLAIAHMPDQYPDPTGQKGDVPIITLRTKDGDFRLIGYHTVLRREIREQALVVGDFFAAKYLGKQKIKSGAFAGSESHIWRTAKRPASHGQAAA